MRRDLLRATDMAFKKLTSGGSLQIPIVTRESLIHPLKKRRVRSCKLFSGGLLYDSGKTILPWVW